MDFTWALKNNHTILCNIPISRPHYFRSKQLSKNSYNRDYTVIYNYLCILTTNYLVYMCGNSFVIQVRVVHIVCYSCWTFAIYLEKNFNALAGLFWSSFQFRVDKHPLCVPGSKNLSTFGKHYPPKRQKPRNESPVSLNHLLLLLYITGIYTHPRLTLCNKYNLVYLVKNHFICAYIFHNRCGLLQHITHKESKHSTQISLYSQGSKLYLNKT